MQTETLHPDADGVYSVPPTGFVDEDNDTYQASDAISKSQLDAIAKSPLHWWHRYVNPDREPSESTPALVLGSAVHAAVLEPDLFLSQYAVAPEDAPKRPTSRQIEAKKPSIETLDAIAYWRDFEAANTGKILLTPDQMKAAIGMRDAAHSHPIARQLLRGGVAEQSVYATCQRTGARVKCRIDYLRSEAGMIVDLKTTEDASPAAFGRSSANWRYPVQTAHYQDVMSSAFGEAPPYWVFLAIEKSPPYAIGVYYVDETVASIGRQMARRDLDALLAARQSGVFPGYSTEVQPLEMPGWWIKGAGL
ncbi:MAG: PD-(D/E)XK nuclease-like domain-containing protein [Leptothrix sp. (in: b-proteobacteria)]